MRSAVARLGGDPQRINPLVPADLVIDHSVQVDVFGTPEAFAANVAREYERNRERYLLLRWGQKAFRNFRVVPPGRGIVHQVNLEFLASVVQRRDVGGETLAFPDTLVGTDSHTTMVNGLGVLGWGVGGIEAEAVLLGQPLYLLAPEVVGFRMHGELPPGATATDLVLTVTQMLRKHGVVGRFVEFTGAGLSSLPLADRATLANMSPEYGATAAIFPVDDETLRYLRMTGRDEALVDLVERYCKTQQLFRTDGTEDPVYSEVLELDLATVEPSLAGPKRPQDRVSLGDVKNSFETSYPGQTKRQVPVVVDDVRTAIGGGSVAIAAITSCTNTSNPAVMIAAGLLAKKAVERGLATRPTVKTSLAPGSRVVTEYLKNAGLLSYLELLRFHVVGYGCTTCIAAGTPVLLANGTARAIEQLPEAGGALLFAPTSESELQVAVQAEAMSQGTRECVSLVLQDGRKLICTPDHEILRADGSWVRADELVPGRDRVVVGLESPLDEPAADETDYVLRAGELDFTAAPSAERRRLLAFARLLGHLLGDGSISSWGQGRMNVGQAIDREAVLDDVEIVTGKRPAANRYDERKWAIVLPKALTCAISALAGVRVGRRIDQAPGLPEFLRDPRCPVAVVREFLGGVFGADGTAPTLHRMTEREEDAILKAPAYVQSAKPQHVPELKAVMGQLIDLLVRCGVNADTAKVYEYPVRRAASSYAAPCDGEPRIEVRLDLSDGLSFVERVGFRYCVDKQLRASAAAVYWRTVDGINRQRLWMASRLQEVHEQHSELSFSQAREMAAAELTQREAVIFPHYSLLQGHDRFTRLPKAEDRKFRPLHRESCGFPSPVEVLEQLGIRHWFARLQPRTESDYSKRYCVDKLAAELPTFTLQVLERRAAGVRPVFDLAVEDAHAFVAGTIAVHNCIGNSGPLPEPIAAAIRDNDLVVAAVLSGNRNFEGRIHPLVRASYLASPPLVVAYALAGSVDVDLATEPLGTDADGKEVYLRDVWPSRAEVQAVLGEVVSPDLFRKSYGTVFEGDDTWRALPVPEGALYAWDGDSTYIQEPPFFVDLPPSPPPLHDIEGARVLALLGDSITTDHISPAGSIPPDSPAGKFLVAHSVPPREFNSYGARRGNHEVMMRGTFGNVRLRNALAPKREGDWTRHFPSGEDMRIFDAAERYRGAGTPLVVIAGKEYGTGSSRDWAAKGTVLLGIKAVLAESFERIHRSNLVGMGVLPLQFKRGESCATHGLDGTETYDVLGVTTLVPRGELTVRVRRDDGGETCFEVIARVDSPMDIEYLRHGGILQMVLRSLAGTL